MTATPIYWSDKFLIRLDEERRRQPIRQGREQCCRRDSRFFCKGKVIKTVVKKSPPRRPSSPLGVYASGRIFGGATYRPRRAARHRIRQTIRQQNEKTKLEGFHLWRNIKINLSKQVSNKFNFSR